MQPDILKDPAAKAPWSVIPEGVTFEAATVGGISGWWAKPARAQKGAAIIHVHGGWFNWGTAQALKASGAFLTERLGSTTT